MPSPFDAYTRTRSSSSIRLGQVFGITVQIHWMWFLVPILFLSKGLPGLVVVAVLFGIVFLHELGHCLAARHYGI